MQVICRIAERHEKNGWLKMQMGTLGTLGTLEWCVSLLKWQEPWDCLGEMLGVIEDRIIKRNKLVSSCDTGVTGRSTFGFRC